MELKDFKRLTKEKMAIEYAKVVKQFARVDDVIIAQLKEIDLLKAHEDSYSSLSENDLVERLKSDLALQTKRVKRYKRKLKHK